MEGLLFWWLLGRSAYLRLERRGPELLTTLRWGWDATAGQSVAEQVEHGAPDGEDGGDGDGPEEHGALIARVVRNLETMPRRTGALMTVLGLPFWLPLYQGAMSLIALATGAVGRSWHLPLYLPEALRMPGAVFALVLGTAMAAALVGLLLRRPREDGDGVRSPEPGPDAERPGARPTTGS